MFTDKWSAFLESKSHRDTQPEADQTGSIVYRRLINSFLSHLGKHPFRHQSVQRISFLSQSELAFLRIACLQRSQHQLWKYTQLQAFNNKHTIWEQAKGRQFQQWVPTQQHNKQSQHRNQSPMEVGMGIVHLLIEKHHLAISKYKHHFWMLPKRMTCGSEVTLFDLTSEISISKILYNTIKYLRMKNAETQFFSQSISIKNRRAIVYGP